MNKMRCEFQSFVYKAGIRSFWSFQNLKKNQFQNCVNVSSKAPIDMQAVNIRTIWTDTGLPPLIQHRLHCRPRYYSLFQKDLQSGLGLKKYEDKGNLDNKVHRMAC